jgi:hypothetical protein
VHQNRGNSGGFSAIWMSPDYSKLITISDYSQVSRHELDLPIKRSGWYQADVNFDENDKLQSLSVTHQGQLLDTDGKTLMGAAESMEWDGAGFLVSFDGHGNIYRYAGKSPQGQRLNTTPVIEYAQKNGGQGNDGLERHMVRK